jgi:Holliday junction resolvasome RuvABC endonuclease subunit
MVQILLGLAEAPASSDAADALAVAICHINASRVQELTFLD